MRIGLLGINALKKDHGILFVYNKCKNRIFSMKDLVIPLNIISINEPMEVIDIIEADIDQENITSNGPTQFVNEINQGISHQKNIRLGTLVKIIQH